MVFSLGVKSQLREKHFVNFGSSFWLNGESVTSHLQIIEPKKVLPKYLANGKRTWLAESLMDRVGRR